MIRKVREGKEWVDRKGRALRIERVGEGSEKTGGIILNEGRDMQEETGK